VGHLFSLHQSRAVPSVHCADLMEACDGFICSRSQGPILIARELREQRQEGQLVLGTANLLVGNHSIDEEDPT